MMGEYMVVIEPGQEQFIPGDRSSAELCVDARYMSYESLCRLYGDERVKSLIRTP